MPENTIPVREAVPEKDTWRLEDIFESDAAWQSEYEALLALPERAVEYEGRLCESGETLLAFLRLEDEASVRLGKLLGYASCKSDQDTSNAFYQDMRGKAVGAYVAFAGAVAFSTPELIAADDDTIEAFYKAVPELKEYARSIYSIRRMAAHVLSPAEERLLAAASEMAQSPDNIRSVFMNADISFPAVCDADGKEHTLTNETYGLLMESPDRTLRENTFKTYYARIAEYKNTLAASLDGQFKQLRFFSEARNYPTTLSAALDANEVPEAVYENLISAVHENMDKMYRYVALRKKLLGVDELHMYDVYTPLVPQAAEKISFDEAKKTVLSALEVLGGDYTALLQKGFDERWIDVYENRGKRGGAYSTDVSRPHPYVLLNHKNTLDSMFTLAHEMGHALHSWYSTANQPVNTSNYVIFVAEVASTCNEVLLMRYLLNKTEDKRERAYLINHFLDQFKSTVYRQTMFAEFELEMGRMSESGETLTADALSAAYMELNKLYFGPDMISDDEIALEWARIPHFFYDYYVFQYATGFAAAVAIANRILTEGERAVSDYKRFLSSGCSADPISLLKIAGVDMSTSAPVKSALSLFDELIAELEETLG